MNLIVIWQEIPENCYVYLLKNLSDKEFNKFLKCHNQLINSDESEELDELNQYIDKIHNYEYYNNGNPVYINDEDKFEDLTKNPITDFSNIDGIIVSGICL